jgi:Flp pilus assembly protein TadG
LNGRQKQPNLEEVYRVASRAASDGVSIESQSQGERVWTRLRKGNDGSALVEFAVVLPMLLLLLTGIGSKLTTYTG